MRVRLRAPAVRPAARPAVRGRRLPATAAPPRPAALATTAAAAPRLGFPDLGIGIGLRTVHYAHILAEHPVVGWFELISDNYLGTGGKPMQVLDQIAARYPVVLHGVSLSIGSTDPLDRAYVRSLRALAERAQARWVSDHLCWTGVAGHNSHDLLPMPYTEEALAHTIRRVHAVQELLGRPLILENPSTYVAFAHATLTEWEFLSALCRATGCGLLVDVNNIYVSHRNHGFAIADYLDGIPWDRVVQFHVAGHSDHGTHCVDTHEGPVPDPVWEVLRAARRRCAGASVLLEWDTDIPPFARVQEEAARAGAFLAAGAP